jgi:hypothetical protein
VIVRASGNGTVIRHGGQAVCPVEVEAEAEAAEDIGLDFAVNVC